VELEGFRQCHIRDGAALIRYFAWLEEQLNNGVELSESQGGDQLKQFRSYVLLVADPLSLIFITLAFSELDLFRGLSFDTITSTGPNAGNSRAILFVTTGVTYYLRQRSSITHRIQLIVQ
jgi:Xaa-Pro aminopeptidase